jgi:diacylglycerol O-acyltransferase
MDRMSTLDAEFLHLEDANAHMHIAGICTFGGTPPTMEELRQLLRSKLHLIPRYRQRVRTVPLELGRPVWVDDPHFHLDYHLRHTALPAPGGDAELCALMGRLMSQPLDRNRPLWEGWLVEGLHGVGDATWALIFKVHHCMVDGIAGVGLLEALLDISPTTELPEPQPWEPEPEPSAATLVLESWHGLLADAGGLLASVPAAVRDPAAGARHAGDLLGGLTRLGRNLAFTPRSSLSGDIGPHRTYAHSSVPFDHVRDVRRILGGTVNDVVLAAVSGGYRRLIEARGDDPAVTEVRSMVPVSVRGGAAHGVADNRVSTLLVELPVEIVDPVERLAVVRERMGDLKGSHMAEAGELVTEVGNLAPPVVVGVVTRLGMRAQQVVAQRAVNTVTTNVPGPQFPIYCLGREMLEYLPFVPVHYGARVGTAILSYNGRLAFGVTGDLDHATDVPVLAAGIAEELAVLRDAALAVGPAADPPSASGEGIPSGVSGLEGP